MGNSLVTVSVCRFVHFHAYRAAGESQSQTRRDEKTQREHEKEDERFYRRGGEVETTPVLPCDEVDRLASQSAGLSTSGGVRGTRSGLPDCTPEEKKDINMAITESLTSLSKAECSLE